MEREYDLIESPDGTQISRLIAVEAGKLDDWGLRKKAKVLGNARLRDSDFGNDYINGDCLNISPIGKLKNPVNYDEHIGSVKVIADLLRKGFDGKDNFDLESICEDSSILRNLMMHEKISGDIYVARFVPKDKNAREPYNEFYSKGFFTETGTGSPELKIDEDDSVRLTQNGMDFEDICSSADIGYCLRRSDCWNFEGVEKVGSANLKRIHIEPFRSTGTYGSTHTNLPGIITVEDLYLKSRLKRISN